MSDAPETLGEVGRMLAAFKDDTEKNFNKVEARLSQLEARPRANFNAIVVPIMVSVIAALIIILLSRAGIKA